MHPPVTNPIRSEFSNNPAPPVVPVRLNVNTGGCEFTGGVGGGGCGGPVPPASCVTLIVFGGNAAAKHPTVPAAVFPVPYTNVHGGCPIAAQLSASVQSGAGMPPATNSVPPHVFCATPRTHAHAIDDTGIRLRLTELAGITNGI